MKATIAQLKKKVQNQTAPAITGLRLQTANPYWANSQQIEYIAEAVHQMVADGENNPAMRYEVTAKQQASLHNWISGLKSKYLH